MALSVNSKLMALTTAMKKMCTCSSLRVAGLTLLIFCFLMTLVPQVNSMPMLEMCGLGRDWTCPKNIDLVPIEVKGICEDCGAYYGNLRGLTFCCRCNEKVFGFCLEAVLGTGKK